ncbi:MAG: glycine/betaine ABC transporter substrate-binding protein, partial [Acidimicrobiia bacterium]
MRTILRRRVFGATLMALALVVAACGGGSGEDATTTTAGDSGPVEGPAITVASFNFPESVILAEIYA